MAIGGADYDVSVRPELVTDAHDGCGDNWGLETLDIAVQAHDLADLVARIEVGEPPACGNGNQPLRYVSMLMQDDVKAISANYDGRAVYPGPIRTTRRTSTSSFPISPARSRGRCTC